MTFTRIATAAIALLIAATVPLRAQHAAPRWGGGGTSASNGASPRQTHPHVAYQGPVISSQVQSWGGSWNGARPTYGGSPPERPRQRGEDLRGFFGYVPPPGQTADNVPVPSVERLSWDVPRQHRSQITWPLRSMERVTATDSRQHHSQITWP